jgi:glutathione S-transferase
MKLYCAPGACSLSPHIVALELGLPLQLIRVDLRSKKTEHGDDYLAINKKGYVPCLVLDNSEALTEGPAIVQYLADLKPDSGLAPKNGTFERYRLQEALNFITSELHKGIGGLFNPAFDDAARKIITDRIELRLGVLSADLTGKDFIFGRQFTVADAYLFTVLNWCKLVKVSLDKYPVLTAYLQRVAARPSAQSALKAEGLI